MTATRITPPPLVRRLTLSLLGWRFDAGVWSLGTQTLTEEAVDTVAPLKPALGAAFSY